MRSRRLAHAAARIDLTVPQGPEHEVTVVDGRFTIATCSCGWSGSARRHRAAARAEGHDHALLYADGSGLGTHPVGAGQDGVDVDLEVDLRPAPSV